MSHLLDTPPRSALTTRHARFAETDGQAMRYLPTIVPFATVDENDPHALGRLVAVNETVVFLQADHVETPPGFKDELRAAGVQMAAAKPTTQLADPRIVALTREDAGEMLALALATKPGPFSLRAQDLGTFWGIRQNGRIVAMAGERMSMPGYSEVSGVCVAEEARGQGLARLLSCHVMAKIVARGDLPFLHAWATNSAAISLYQSIGFSVRRQMQIAMMRRIEG